MNSIHRPTLLALGLALLAAFTLNACNTTRGLGRDVERAGQEIQDVTR
jgi:predicted small secreted protein